MGGRRAHDRSERLAQLIRVVDASAVGGSDDQLVWFLSVPMLLETESKRLGDRFIEPILVSFDY